MAVQKDSNVLHYASDEMRKDPDVIQAAMGFDDSDLPSEVTKTSQETI